MGHGILYLRIMSFTTSELNCITRHIKVSICYTKLNVESAAHETPDVNCPD